MKIRTDFVTNSSSSGFVAIKVKSKTLSSLLKKKKLPEDIFDEIADSYGGETGEPGAIDTSVAITICNLILLGGMPYIEAYEEVTEDLECGDYDSIEDIIDAVENALEEIKEIEVDDEDEEDDAKQYKKILQLIKLICDNKEKIDADATADIESGRASSESGGPDFAYSGLSVKNGKGTYTSYSVYDGYYGDDANPSKLYSWAKAHGYYDLANERPGFQGGYDESFYFNPPYDELAETYEDVVRVQVGESIDENAGKCEDLTFVITGKVNLFKNRDEFKSYVESQGGHVSGSVSKNTDYLVNNDATSESSKNMKAKELGIEILTEEEFIQRFGMSE